MTQVSQLASSLPEMPLIETWEWKTDILTSVDNHYEQRIAARISPRIKTETRYLVLNEAQRRGINTSVSREFRTHRVMPHFQYAADLTAAAEISDTRIYFNPQKTNLRVGEPVFIYTNSIRDFTVYEVEELHSDGATLSSGLTEAYSSGWVIPGVISRLEDGSGLSMGHVSGEAMIVGQRRDTLIDFKRPGASSQVLIYDGRPVLLQRYIVETPFEEKMSMGSRIVDSDTGIFQEFKGREYPYLISNVMFKIKRVQEPASMDYWREFFDLIKGRQGSFYLPSWREDLHLREPIEAAMNVIKCTPNDWPELFAGKKEYDHILLQAPDRSTFLCRIHDHEVVEGGVDFIINDIVPSKFRGTQTKISYVYLCRLNADTVKLEHGPLDTKISFSVRTVSDPDQIIEESGMIFRYWGFELYAGGVTPENTNQYNPFSRNQVRFMRWSLTESADQAVTADMISLNPNAVATTGIADALVDNNDEMEYMKNPSPRRVWADFGEKVLIRRMQYKEGGAAFRASAVRVIYSDDAVNWKFGTLYTAPDGTDWFNHIQTFFNIWNFDS